MSNRGHQLCCEQSTAALVWTLLNRYATLFRRISWSTEMIGRDDWKFVLTCVRDALERDEAEFQEATRRDSGLEKC